MYHVYMYIYNMYMYVYVHVQVYMYMHVYNMYTDKYILNICIKKIFLRKWRSNRGKTEI